MFALLSLALTRATHHHSSSSSLDARSSSSNSARCPAATKGLLFNHVSKTGGTVMKELLISAMGAAGCAAVGCPDAQSQKDRKSGWDNVTIINRNEHTSASSSLIGVDGALVIQEDVYNLTVSSADAASFFVVGTVRRPCDYMVSFWAFESAQYDDERKWGVTPPYDTPNDTARFDTWVSDVTAQRDRGASRLDGATFMSTALSGRYDDAGRDVHCWVRTHSMVTDLKRCMAQYEACGGTYVRDGLSESAVKQAVQKGTAGIPPSEYANCSTFFKEGTDTWASVMTSEAQLIADYDLGKCCSD